MLKPTNDKPKLDVLINKIPDVIINKEALKKMKVYIDECNEEIGWLGTAYKIEGGFYIQDVLLFDQEVHSTTTEITPEGLSEFGETLLQEPGGVDLWNSIKVWGHSHVSMSTFSSGQDDKQMELFSDCGHDFFIRIIGNKKDEMRVDLYDFETGVIYNYVPWQMELTEDEFKIRNHILALEEEIKELEEELNVFNNISEALKEEVVSEMKEKVRKKITTSTYYGNGYQLGKAGVVQIAKDTQVKKDWDYDEKVIDVKYKKKPKDIFTIDNNLLFDLGEMWTSDDAREMIELYGYDETDFTESEVYELLQYAWDIQDASYYYNRGSSLK